MKLKLTITHSTATTLIHLGWELDSHHLGGRGYVTDLLPPAYLDLPDDVYYRLAGADRWDLHFPPDFDHG